MLLATFTCGFYRVTDLDGPKPRVDFLRAFGGENCAVPVLIESLWIQTIPDEHALVTLDVTDSARPREISRVVFDSTFSPHWLALDEGGARLVVNDGKERIFLVTLDRSTVGLVIDPSFREAAATAPGVTEPISRAAPTPPCRIGVPSAHSPLPAGNLSVPAR